MDNSTSEISPEKTWMLLKKKKRETLKEKLTLLLAAQNNALRTNYIKARIDKTLQNSYLKCYLKNMNRSDKCQSK